MVIVETIHDEDLVQLLHAHKQEPGALSSVVHKIQEAMRQVQTAISLLHGAQAKPFVHGDRYP